MLPLAPHENGSERAMRLSVSDVVSPSYFVATAAVELGFFKAEGIDAEFVQTPAEASTALRDGEVDFVGVSAYTGLRSFPGWRGGKLLCALPGSDRRGADP